MTKSLLSDWILTRENNNHMFIFIFELFNAKCKRSEQKTCVCRARNFNGSCWMIIAELIGQLRDCSLLSFT